MKDKITSFEELYKKENGLINNNEFLLHVLFRSQAYIKNYSKMSKKERESCLEYLINCWKITNKGV